jgi:HAD superfamily 5'-nucleotidase-like hydrolase
LAIQLTLPLVDVPDPAPRPVSPARRVYANRNLKLAKVDWVGFDMDYTLAIYHQEEMDRLSIQATVAKLIARGYPPFIAQLDYPLTFPIRGLLIDKHLGNVLKMNRFKVVRKGYHGLKELDRNELRALYHERKIRHKSSRYHWIDTLYALSEAAMYAAIIEAFEERGMAVKYGRLFLDIRECIDEAHSDGTILGPVMKEPDRFIIRDPQLASTLHKLRSAGKRLFVLTNSREQYTERLLGHLLDGVLPDYPSYRHYFDLVLVAARKPRFFQERLPFLEKKNGELVPAPLPLERGKFYEGGNLRDLMRTLGVPGQGVLYVGDHIYGDMLRSKKDSTWRTAMVIPELEAEVDAHQACIDDFLRWNGLYIRRASLEDDLRIHQQRLKDLGKRSSSKPNGASNGHMNGEVTHLKHVVSAIRRQLRAVERETIALRRRIDERFHSYWGPLLKEHNELSLFGHQVSEYACVYTSRVSNLLSYSPHQYFRSPHDLMHHEL